MAMKVIWSWDSKVAITSFTVLKSTNKGETYSTLGTVNYDLVGANFDRAKRIFFYNDGAGNPGDIYRVTATGANGTSAPGVGIAPAVKPDLCQIIGYTRDVFGNVDTRLAIRVYSYGSRGEQWAQNPTGVIGYNANSLAVVANNMVVHPDSGGIWSIALVRKSYARVSIPELEFDWAFEVPDREGPINIRDIPQVRGGDFGGMWPEMLGYEANLTRG